MNDRQLDGLILAASSNSADHLSDKRIRHAGDELLEQIMSDTYAPRTEPDVEFHVPLGPAPASPLARPAARGARARRAVTALLVAAAVATAIAVPTMVFRSGRDAVVVASAQPARDSDLFLIDEPGWTVTHVARVTKVSGELFFRRGAQELQINWYEADDYDGFVRDRRADDDDPVRVAVLGREGLGFSSTPDNHSVLLAPVGRTFIEIREWEAGAESFDATLARIRQVSTAEWEAGANSDVIVFPAEERSVVDSMLADVTLPPGFAPSSLPTGDISDYAVFGRHVIGQVTCTWLADYRRALADKDEPEQSRIEKALRGVRDSQVLRQLAAAPYQEMFPGEFRKVIDRAIEDHYFQGYRQQLMCD